MIEIIYDRTGNKVSIQGHAGAGAYGEDVVCAGVSTLAQTLAANVRHWRATGRLEGEPEIQLESGFGVIGCTPKATYSQSVKQVMVAICAGFEIIAHTAPKYVRFGIGSTEDDPQWVE